MFHNPVHHLSIEVLTSLSLPTATDCIVVNRDQFRSADDSNTQGEQRTRKIIRGPSVYFPIVRETVMSFTWHGRNGLTTEYHYEPNADRFNVLKTSTRAWNIDIPFSSSSTVKGVLKLSFQFCIDNVEALVDGSTDLIGDLLDAVTIDATNIGATGHELSTIDEFVLKSLFSDLKFFTRATSRAHNIGVTLEAVSFRGFEPT